MFPLKPLTPAGIAEALKKADRYRLINDPSSAESICLDVLDLEPDNQQALVMLLLARTDQFSEGVAVGVERAREVLPRLRDDYKRAYYTGIICERRAKAQLRTGTPGAGSMAYDGLREAMSWYERAEAIRPPGNDEALLRWNTCARILTRDPHLAPRPDDRFEPSFEEG
jgi:hypothetical protein